MAALSIGNQLQHHNPPPRQQQQHYQQQQHAATGNNSSSSSQIQSKPPPIQHQQQQQRPATYAERSAAPPPPTTPASAVIARPTSGGTKAPPAATASSPNATVTAAAAATPAVLEELQSKHVYNPNDFDVGGCSSNARFFVIKSYSEDDIHRSIKYEIWCSTEHGNKRLDAAFRERLAFYAFSFTSCLIRSANHSRLLDYYDGEYSENVPI